MALAVVHNNPGIAADLNDDDKTIIAGLLRDTIAADRFPHSPRIRRLRTILAKLEPPALTIEPLPPPKPSAVPSMALARKRRR